MKRKITAAAAFALCVAMGVCACSPSEKEDTFTGKEKEELRGSRILTGFPLKYMQISVILT